MAHAPALAADPTADRGAPVRPTVQAPPVTPGKVAMWLFLATEIMFFTGLIGSYIVLRAGSPPTAYSNLYPPETDLTPLADAQGWCWSGRAPSREGRRGHPRRHRQGARGGREMAAETPMVIQAGLSAVPGRGPGQAVAGGRRRHRRRAGARDAQVAPAVRPPGQPAEHRPDGLQHVHPDLLVGDHGPGPGGHPARRSAKLSAYLLATVLIGSVFLGIQVLEYYKLMLGDLHPVGISRTGHFRPSVSLFASCFFTMTGFHGAHVFGGVVMLACIFVQSLRGAYTLAHHSPVELVGLYWHFVDLVWILLFTVVYLI
jgi:heme/copper-type cytochrome/quinol oxidase subunit 3